MSSFTDDCIPIFRESSDLNTGSECTVVVVKKEFVDNELHTHLEVVGEHVFIIVIGFNEMHVGSQLNILLGDETCRFISYACVEQPKYFSWSTTSAYSPYSKTEGLLLIFGGILLSTFLFIFNAIIILPAVVLSITLSLIIIYLSKVFETGPLVSTVTCKILDMDIDCYDGFIRGHLLLAGVHKNGKSEIFTLCTVPAKLWEHGVLYFEGFELRVGDIISVPTLGNNYLLTYLTEGSM